MPARRWDDLINAAFEKAFPEYLDDAKLAKISENETKSPAGKKRWREFMMPFEKIVTDYNFGTLIRLDCEGEYDEQNSMFGECLATAATGGRHPAGRWTHAARTANPTESRG